MPHRARREFSVGTNRACALRLFLRQRRRIEHDEIEYPFRVRFQPVEGVGLDDFAATWLFGPLDIRDVHWRRSPDGQATGGGGLKLRPRDVAKLGELYRADGVWNGRRVLSAAWVAESRRTTTHIRGDGYGYLWWKRALARDGFAIESYFTSGNGGNFVFVFPSLDLVVAFTGSNYDSRASDQPFQILAERLLPIVR